MPELHLPLYPVLLAGGMGTRLWPVSRQLYPKQLVRFIGNESLIQATIGRLLSLVDPKNIRIVCGREHTNEIARHMHDVQISPEGRIISEPCGRNTAPAILLALFHLLEREKDAIVCIFPADHVIRNTSAFIEKTKTAARLAQKGHIVTFGITPHYPETGYGYIEGNKMDLRLSGGALPIKRFVEKPDLERAKGYVASGNYFWNSGMFTFKASVMMEEFRIHQPDLFGTMSQMVSGSAGPTMEAYRQLENVSIDYAIMEKTNKGVVLPSDFGWSDIGSWKSLYDFIAKDSAGNVALGDVMLRNTAESFIMGQSRLVALNNVKHLAVVETPDAVFVSDLESSRDVKDIVQTLKTDDRQEYYQHGRIYHKWGSTTKLEQGDRYAVDRLMIYPGFSMMPFDDPTGTLHLTVIEGTVTLIADGQSSILGTGESISFKADKGVLLENGEDLSAGVVRVRQW